MRRTLRCADLGVFFCFSVALVGAFFVGFEAPEAVFGFVVPVASCIIQANVKCANCRRKLVADLLCGSLRRRSLLLRCCGCRFLLGDTFRGGWLRSSDGLGSFLLVSGGCRGRSLLRLRLGRGRLLGRHGCLDLGLGRGIRLQGMTCSVSPQGV